MPGYRRTQFIVHQKLQYGIFVYMFGIAILSGVLNISWASTLLTAMRTDGFGLNVWMLLAANLLLLVSWLVFGLYYTNRVFGPLYRLQMDIRGILAGTARAPVRLRKGDYFGELVNDFNALMEKMEKQQRVDSSGDDVPRI